MIGVSDIAQARRMAPVMWDRWSRERKRSVAPSPHTPHPRAWPDRGLHAAWVGHSTVLLKIDGFTLVTDPVFSRRIGLNFGPMTIGMKRLVEPALRRTQLPHVDLILLSHAHMDHFDLPSLRSLESQRAQVVTAANTGDLLRAGRYGGVHELAWGESVRIGEVSIRAFEVNHWGARMRSDTHRGYSGYVIETARYRVLFGGDTAMTSNFRALHSARGIDLAIMPIGAYNPWIRFHCTPEQALKMADDAGAEHILPVHHQTFQLSSEPVYEPIERLSRALSGSPHRLALCEIGQEAHLER